jgi:glycosyltransferase involved in cell wall biosynthesis
MSVVFFHQNEVSSAQGGIERYIATLMDQAGESCLLVTEACSSAEAAALGRRIRVPLLLRSLAPKWISYILGVTLSLRKIRRAIDRIGPCTLEFSRPHYVLIGWMFRGAKVYTVHGTGPPRSEPVNYWIHWFSCLLLPWSADVIQIVGRDNRGLPGIVATRMATRTRYIDAWFDEIFHVTPFRAAAGPLRVFFAGRLAPMKNPELLFRIIEVAGQRHGHRLEFRYFGADGDRIPGSLQDRFPSSGLLSAAQLAREIAECHVGILCSGYGEGSPFIVVEALACGRGFILPPLPGLLEAYRGNRGILFAAAHTVDAFIDCLVQMETAIRDGLTPEEIAADVSHRSSREAARHILQSLEADRR